MNRASLFRTMAVATALLIHTGCGDDSAPRESLSPEAVPGTLAVTLSSSVADDGAVAFRLTGQGITNLRPAHEGMQIFTELDGDAYRVAVLGAGLSGEIAHFDVSDVRTVDAYDVALLEVADEENDARRDLSGHTLGLKVAR